MSKEIDKQLIIETIQHFVVLSMIKGMSYDEVLILFRSAARAVEIIREEPSIKEEALANGCEKIVAEEIERERKRVN